VITCAQSLQFAEVTAEITRADGRVEHLVLDRYESVGFRIKRWARRVLAPHGLSLLVAAGAASMLAPPLAGPLGAATVIVNGGQAIVTNLVSGIGGTVPKFVAWGTGAGTAAAADTTLFTESTDESRTSGTVSRVTTTVTNDTYQVVGTITVATANKTITNVGLFDASTAGNLYFKSDFTGLALSIGDSITFTIKVKFS
jgi:hypothetical protein